MANTQPPPATPIILVLRSPSVNVPLQARDVPSLQELVAIVREKFPDLSTEPVQFRYEVGGCTNCSLDSELEFGTMLVMAGMYSPPVVQIHVGSVGRGDAHANMDGSQQGRTQLAVRNITPAAPPRRSPRDGNDGSTQMVQYSPQHIFLPPVASKIYSTMTESVETHSGNVMSTVKDMDKGYTLPEGNLDTHTSDDEYVPYEICEEKWEDAREVLPLTDSDFLTSVSELLTPDVINKTESPPEAQITAGVNRKRKTGDSAQTTKTRRGRADGDWFTDVLQQVPYYDINKPAQKDRLLMSKEWATNIKGIGQIFRDGVEQYRTELAQYASKLGFHYKWKRNDARYTRVDCKLKDQDGCEWFIKTALQPVTRYCEIKQANLVHTCRLSVMRNDTTRLSAKLIAEIIIEKVKANPTIKPKQVETDLLLNHGFEIPYMKVWRGVEAARASIFGSYTTSFDELRWYSEAIRTTDPGSIVELKTHPKTNKFHRLFFAFKASLEGFKYCRPMLFIDGTFMKNRYKGTILVATAKDGNQGLFPVAFAIVDSETTANWVWFIRLIQEHVHHHQEILYVSDRAGGILAAFDEVYEKSTPNHFYCLYHLMKNLRSAFPKNRYSELHRNTMCKLLSEIAYAPNMRCYEVALQRFHNLGGDISRRWMADLPPERWCVAFSPQLLRYGELTSNAAESFNSWILTARALPITYIIDMIRAQLMQWFVERREESAKWTGAMTEMMEAKWNHFVGNESGYTIRTAVIGEEYEIISEPSATVNIKHRTCTCWSWQVIGFPCTHAIAVITRERLDIKDLIDPYYFADSFRKAYSQDIHSIPSTERYEFLDLDSGEKILPPVMKKGAGRPQIKRFRKTRVKKIKKFVCRRCGKLGRHYWTTCQEALENPISIENGNHN